MKILFISDTHANYPALKALDPYIDNVDVTICLGDIVGYYCDINEVIDYLKEKKVICILGNHDRYLIEGLEKQTKLLNSSVRFGIEIAKQTISKENLRWLNSLPISLGLIYDQCSILCCHGSPYDPISEYVFDNNNLASVIEKHKYNIIALGHTHREFVRKINDTIILNPGSVGQARDHKNFVCAKILDTESMNIETLLLEYDYKSTINKAEDYGADQWVYRHFNFIE